MDIDQTNLRIIELMRDAFNRKDLDTIISFFAEDGVYEDNTGSAPTGDRYVGPDAIRGIVEALMQGFPDYYFENPIPLVSGNHGALEYTGVIPGEPVNSACSSATSSNLRAER